MVMKLDVGRESEARFGQDFNFRFSKDADNWLKFMPNRDSEIVICSRVVSCEL